MASQVKLHEYCLSYYSIAAKKHMTKATLMKEHIELRASL